MRLAEVQHGATTVLRFEPETEPLPKDLERGMEVRLLLPRTGDEVVLSTETSRIIVVEVDEHTRRSVETLRQTNPARLCWIAVRKDGSAASELTVQVHRFRSAIEWPDGAIFHVDERIVEQVEKHADRHMTSERACRWLADEIFIPAVSQEDRVRAIATGAPDTGGRFRLLGAHVAVDIEPHRSGLRVESISKLRRRSGFQPPQFLLSSSLQFSDMSAAGGLRPSIKAQVDRLVAEADSYIALWEKYQSIEASNLLQRAREIGWLQYETFELMPDGLWRLRFADASKLERFTRALRTAGQEGVEAASDVPAALVEDAPESEEATKKARAAVGTVKRVRIDQREIHLKPFDEDSDALPPRKGTLFAALHGDRKRLERRDQAVQRIKSGDPRMPQLPVILEGASPYLRRVDELRALTKAARDVFESEPTRSQRQAIDSAINARDVVVIQGPPGTGKTKVIEAILVRLAELESERPEVSGRTLLTSYQHDAVDNAANRSRVYGLPPARFGGRRRDENPRDEQIHRWAIEVGEHVDAALAELPEERPLTFYKSVRDRVAIYASGTMADGELRKLFDDLAELPAGTLPTDLWERLQRTRRRLASTGAGPGDLEQELTRKAVRGLRTTSEAFADDGPRKARQVLDRLRSMLTEEEAGLLERASATAAGETFPEMGHLSNLRDELLDRLDHKPLPGDRSRIDPETLDSLNGALIALHDIVLSSTAGIADALFEYREALKKDPAGVRRVLEAYASVYAVTCQQAVAHHVIAAKGGDISKLEFDNVIVDEAARANPLDLFIPMSLAERRIILVGDHRQLPHLLDPDVESAVAGSVRDQEQHALKESLFQRLFERLPHLNEGLSKPRVITLRDQFRMHPILGGFVSDVFYKPYEEHFSSPRPASDFAHQLAGYQRAGRPVCAAWIDVPSSAGPEQAGRSKSRQAEARRIAKEVRRLLNGDATVTIGVVAFYRAQVEEILEALIDEGVAERDLDDGEIRIRPEWRVLERVDGRRAERLRVGTVDAFQGMEFDVVFLSVTRSNSLPAANEHDRRRKYGHLMLENRLCVAMSRQRKLLVVVGDRAMFSTPEGQEAVPALSRFIELCGGEHGLVA